MMNNNICIRGAYYNSGMSINYSTMLKKYNVKSLTKIALWRWKGKHIIYVNNTNVGPIGPILYKYNKTKKKILLIIII